MPNKTGQSQPASLPMISVVTVVRNGKRFVEQTIKSVLEQRYDKIEYIVIDGGSTDGTVEIIRSHETRIAKWVSEKDGGIADAFNKGLARAAGDYIMFLNADDALAAPNVVGSIMAIAVEHGCPDVVYGDCDLHDQETGQRLYRTRIGYERSLLLRGQMLPHPGMFIHRRYFDRFGQFDTSFRFGMDYELLVRGVPEVGAVRVPILVTCVRTGGVSTRHRALVVDEVIRALAKNKRFRFWFEPFLLRIRYASRYILRRIAEALGLYKFWLRRERRFTGADTEDHGIRHSV